MRSPFSDLMITCAWPINALINTTHSASGLGRACVFDICGKGGHAAILDMNEDLGAALVEELGPSSRLFECDVSNTDSIAAAVAGIAEWTKKTGKPLGGIIPAAGVGRPGLVCQYRDGPGLSCSNCN